jgi:peroxiredoxin
MARPDNLYKLPNGLPVPEDDGACNHLTGTRIPSVALGSTDGSMVDLSTLPGWTVVYCYPRTGRPDEPSPTGWNDIPGARGCTPQSCGFRDHYQEIRDLGIDSVFGLSTQDTPYQQEVKLIKRLTLIVHDDVIEHVFYPVFPPDSNAPAVVHWLVERTTGQHL